MQKRDQDINDAISKLRAIPGLRDLQEIYENNDAMVKIFQDAEDHFLEDALFAIRPGLDLSVKV